MKIDNYKTNIRAKDQRLKESSHLIDEKSKQIAGCEE